MINLHLDGVQDFGDVFGSYEKGSVLKREVAARVTAVFHAALIMIRVTALHVVRGLVLVGSGVYLRDKKLVVGGIKDFGSLLVELVVLPILGLVSLASPAFGREMAREFVKLLDMEKKEYGAVPEKVLRVAFPLVTFFDKLGSAGQEALAGESPVSELKGALLAGLAPFFNEKNGLFSAFRIAS